MNLLDENQRSLTGNWKEFQPLQANLTVDKSLVAHVRILQGQPDEKGNQPHWEKTMILQPGRNEMVLLIHGGTYENHGFFFYGDSTDYMRIFTLKAKEVNVFESTQ